MATIYNINIRYRIILLFTLIPTLSFGQAIITYNQLKDRITIALPDGLLSIRPLSDNAIRIHFTNGTINESNELVFTSDNTVPKFKVAESHSLIEITTKGIRVSLDKQTGTLSYSDISGKKFLSEKAGTRSLTPNTVMGEPCFIAEQSFESPSDECLFGLGQFQDGYSNLKNISRQLTQFNGQVSIPYIYSSKGYGLLWHQYGLTDFNPADNIISLEKQKIDQLAKGRGRGEDIAATDSMKAMHIMSLYTGKFTLSNDGEYSFMLKMGIRSRDSINVSIDGTLCIEQVNYFVTPSLSALVKLKSGDHTIHVVCQSLDQPEVSWKFGTSNAKP